MDCEKRYRNIRDAWFRAIKNGRATKYQKYLEFLLPWTYLSNRPSTNGNDGLQGEEQAEEDEEVVDDDEEVAVADDAKPDWDEDMVVGDESLDALANDDTDTARTSEARAWDLPEPSMARSEEAAANASALLMAGDPLKMYFSSIYSTVKNLQPENILTLQKEIFDLVHAMQVREKDQVG